MEEFLRTFVSEQEPWNLLYFALVLDCDVRILESYWHGCPRDVCLKWDEKEQHFQSKAFLNRLAEHLFAALKTAYPTWGLVRDPSFHRQWNLERPDLYDNHVRQYININFEPGKAIKMTAWSAYLYGGPVRQASFVVECKPDYAYIGYTYDHEGGWRVSNSDMFLSTVEKQVERFGKLFKQ